MKRLLSSLCYHIALAGFILIAGIAIHAISAWSAEPLPRTIIALYDSRNNESVYLNRPQVLAAMPLNHLGLVIESHDIASGLPDIKNRKDVRGVLTWFAPGTKLQDPTAYLAWANEVVDVGKKFVIMGEFGFLDTPKGKEVTLTQINDFLRKIGIQVSGNSINSTYLYHFIQKDKTMVGFERGYDVIKPAFPMVAPVNQATQSYLIIGKKGKPDTYSHLITLARNGGYVAGGYEFYNPDNDYISNSRQWYINPFEFFRQAFTTDDLPKPDTTTLAGRRIYYSQIDGDGWNNVSFVGRYRENRIFCPQVIMENAIIPYLDLPVTIAPIAGDLDPEWFGVPQGQNIARKFFALPNVEAGSHTYSHPFDWAFFTDNTPQKELPFLPYYPGRVWDKKEEVQKMFSLFKESTPANHNHLELLEEGYTTPRAYAVKPFDINMEISGSLKTITPFLPSGKEIKIMQWSGNTEPFEHTIALSRQAGIRNINGGDSRFDTEFPSRMWLSPVGIKIGDQLQIYSSNSNENTYTNLWTGKFHGFRYLRKTLDNTESPIRLKPFNIYYHMYSGERDASLNALLMNLDYARSQEIAPINTSHYAGIGDGFFSADIVPLGSNSWRIENRGALTTIRFDNHSLDNVDFTHSSGVIGQRHFQGSLYIYLDDAVSTPVITLKTDNANTQAYLLQSRWHLTQFTPKISAFTFHAQGFGAGDMQWVVPKNGTYEVILPDLPRQLVQVNNNTLTLKLPMVAINGVEVQVRYRG